MGCSFAWGNWATYHPTIDLAAPGDNIYSTIMRGSSTEDACVSRERHRQALSKTLKNLDNSLKDKNIDIFAEDIRLAMREITKITGNIDIENILEIIFNDFCIGK